MEDVTLADMTRDSQADAQDCQSRAASLHWSRESLLTFLAVQCRTSAAQRWRGFGPTEAVQREQEVPRETDEAGSPLSLSFSPSVLRGGTCGARKLSRASCSPPAAPDQRFPRASSIRVPRVTDPQSQREKRPFLPDTIVVALIRGMRGTTAEDVHTRNVRRTSCLLLTYSGERRASRSATQS